jgi:hypothetical protein
MRSKPKLCIDIDKAYFDPVENEDGSLSYAAAPWAELFDDLDARARDVLGNIEGRKDWRSYATWWAYAIISFARAHNRTMPPSAIELCALAFKPKDSGYVPDELRTLLVKPSGESKKDTEWKIAVAYVADAFFGHSASWNYSFADRIKLSGVKINALRKYVTEEAKKYDRHCNLDYKDARAWLSDKSFAAAVDYEIQQRLDNQIEERLP